MDDARLSSRERPPLNRRVTETVEGVVWEAAE
jgi:hypothetical protein